MKLRVGVIGVLVFGSLLSGCQGQSKGEATGSAASRQAQVHSKRKAKQASQAKKAEQARKAKKAKQASQSSKPARQANQASGQGQASQAAAPALPQGTNHDAAATAYAQPASWVHANMFNRLDPNQPKRVFLTFDDGPNLTMTPQILAVLKKAQVPATFFVIGQQIGAKTAPMLRAEYDQGNAIGLHSFTHTYGFETSGSAAKTQWELTATLAAVRRVLGSGFATHAWRYPGGHMSWHTLAAPDQVIARAGMSWIDWNAASGDALGAKSPTTVPAMLQYHLRSIQAYGNHNATVVLMHDAPDKTTTLAALPQIIDYYKQHGYQFGVIA